MEKTIMIIQETLAKEMSSVEQFINWEVVFDLGSSDEEYFKAAKAIVEPLIKDEEASEEFNSVAEELGDLWEQYVRNSAEGLVHRDNWIKLIDLIRNEGY